MWSAFPNVKVRKKSCDFFDFVQIRFVILSRQFLDQSDEKKNWFKVAWLFPRLTLATLYTYSIQDLIGLFNHLRIVIGWSNFIVVQLKILFLKTEHIKGAFNFYYINV